MILGDKITINKSRVTTVKLLLEPVNCSGLFVSIKGNSIKLAIVSAGPITRTSLEGLLLNPALVMSPRPRANLFAHHNRCFQFTVAILSGDVWRYFDVVRNCSTNSAHAHNGTWYISEQYNVECIHAFLFRSNSLRIIKTKMLKKKCNHSFLYRICFITIQ